MGNRLKPALGGDPGGTVTFPINDVSSWRLTKDSTRADNIANFSSVFLAEAQPAVTTMLMLYPLAE
jgi:hypothetical protein